MLVRDIAQAVVVKYFYWGLISFIRYVAIGLPVEPQGGGLDIPEPNRPL